VRCFTGQMAPWYEEHASGNAARSDGYDEKLGDGNGDNLLRHVNCHFLPFRAGTYLFPLLGSTREAPLTERPRDAESRAAQDLLDVVVFAQVRG
jgi:hypothetical protein